VPVDPLTTTAALTGISAWAWDKYGKSIVDSAAGAIKDQWKRVKPPDEKKVMQNSLYLPLA
jgi:hypothetical protein